MTDETVGGDGADSPDAEIAEIQHTMKTDFRTYYRDQDMRDRYLELLKTREAAQSSPGSPDPDQTGPVTSFPDLAVRPAKQPTPVTLPPGPVGHGHVTAHPTEEIMANLEKVPEAAAMLKSWGADAAENVAYMARESTEILNALPPEDATALWGWLEDMSPAGQVKLYRHLADAGRARGTR